MLLTIEKIRQYKESWDADKHRRYLRGAGVNTFEDYLITRAYVPDKCSRCNMLDSFTSRGFIDFHGLQIKYDCTWCYETVYVPHPANETV